MTTHTPPHNISETENSSSTAKCYWKRQNYNKHSFSLDVLQLCRSDYISVPRGPLSHNLSMEIWHPFMSQKKVLTYSQTNYSPRAWLKRLVPWLPWQRQLIIDVIMRMPLGTCDTVIKKNKKNKKCRWSQGRSNLSEFAGSFSHAAETGSTPPIPSLTLSIKWIQSYSGRAIISSHWCQRECA